MIGNIPLSFGVAAKYNGTGLSNVLLSFGVAANYTQVGNVHYIYGLSAQYKFIKGAITPSDPDIIQPNTVKYNPYEGQDLNRFIQNWLVGLSGLSGSVVIPEQQSEPPVIPQAGNAWCSFRYEKFDSNVHPYIGYNSANEYALLQNHEMLHLAVTFYDLGTNGQAAYLAALVRDNIKIPWNCYYLQNNNFNIKSTVGPYVIPTIFKQRWMYKERLDIYLMRNVGRQYDIPNVEKAVGSINAIDFVVNFST